MPESAQTSRASLKVYLGYAAGVGKTFQMLADGRTAAERGVDIVLAYFQPHARPDTIEQAHGLEIVPHRKIEYRGKTFEEMDTEAVLLRGPSIAGRHYRVFRRGTANEAHAAGLHLCH